MNTTFNILELLAIVKVHDIQVSILPWREDPFDRHILGYKFIFSKKANYTVKYVSDTDIKDGFGAYARLKFIFEKSIRELEEACKNDQT